MKLIKQAQEDETKEYAFRIYLAMHPKADPEKFTTFNEYWEEIKPNNAEIDARTKDEIMKEIAEIENKFRKEE